MASSRAIAHHLPLIAISLTIPTHSLAQAKPTAPPEINIDYKTPAFQAKQLQSGAIQVTARYTPPQPSDPDESPNLTYRITYNGKAAITDGESYTRLANIRLQDLDGNGTAEVIVDSYSGGAHCCTNTKIFSWQNQRFSKTETGLLDGRGGTFKDLNQDGKPEFVSYDNAFLYTFSSYAGSFAPSKIYQFRNGRLVDATRQYPNHLRAELQRMFQAFTERKRDNSEINGILAGYVAQKALLGEYQQGWKVMLANYDRTSNWGVDEYPNFPAALQAFLKQHGYLNKP